MQVHYFITVAFEGINESFEWKVNKATYTEVENDLRKTDFRDDHILRFITIDQRHIAIRKAHIKQCQFQFYAGELIEPAGDMAAKKVLEEGRSWDEAQAEVKERYAPAPLIIGVSGCEAAFHVLETGNHEIDTLYTILVVDEVEGEFFHFYIDQEGETYMPAKKLVFMEFDPIADIEF